MNNRRQSEEEQQQQQQQQQQRRRRRSHPSNPFKPNVTTKPRTWSLASMRCHCGLARLAASSAASLTGMDSRVSASLAEEEAAAAILTPLLGCS